MLNMWTGNLVMLQCTKFKLPFGNDCVVLMFVFWVETNPSSDFFT